MAWHERSLALEAQVRATLWTQRESCAGGMALQGHHNRGGRQGRLAQQL